MRGAKDRRRAVLLAFELPLRSDTLSILLLPEEAEERGRAQKWPVRMRASYSRPLLNYTSGCRSNSIAKVCLQHGRIGTASANGADIWTSSADIEREPGGPRTRGVSPSRVLLLGACVCANSSMKAMRRLSNRILAWLYRAWLKLVSGGLEE